MYGTSMRENREIPCSPVPLIGGGPSREGYGRTPGMHGDGKSYHLVVLTNRSNKASAAEAGGKEVSRGETGWQYTHRTLCRIERGIAARPVTPGGCRGLEEC